MSTKSAIEWTETTWNPTTGCDRISPGCDHCYALTLAEWRRRLEDVRLRGLECFAAARLGLGGPTLPQAEECGRRMIELAPYRESGHRILMEALERRGNAAEALLVYDQLRVMLRDELGIAPGPVVQGVYRRLLDETSSTTT